MRRATPVDPLPPYITSYNGWQPSYSGKFNPATDNFFVPYGTGPFPLQGSGTALNSIGNATRFNPKVRYFPNLNENMSLARTFPIHEKMRMEFRAEAFNVFNRVRFGTGKHAVAERPVRRPDRRRQPAQYAPQFAARA